MGSRQQGFFGDFYYASLCDLQKSSDKQTQLMDAAWPKEDERKAYMAEMSKAFTGVSGNYIYRNEPTLHK